MESEQHIHAHPRQPIPVKASARNRAISIRTATDSDANSIASLGSQVFSQSFGYSLSPEDLAAYLEDAYTPSQIAQDLADPLNETVVACDEQNRLLGFALLTQGTMEECIADKKDPIELQRLYVHPDSHGSGIGKALVATLEALARERGFKTMWLGVWEDNVKAQRLYAKMGFSKVGDHGFKMGNCVQTDWIMSKSL